MSNGTINNKEPIFTKKFGPQKYVAWDTKEKELKDKLAAHVKPTNDITTNDPFGQKSEFDSLV